MPTGPPGGQQQQEQQQQQQQQQQQKPRHPDERAPSGVCNAFWKTGKCDFFSCKYRHVSSISLPLRPGEVVAGAGSAGPSTGPYGPSSSTRVAGLGTPVPPPQENQTAMGSYGPASCLPVGSQQQQQAAPPAAGPDGIPFPPKGACNAYWKTGNCTFQGCKYKHLDPPGRPRGGAAAAPSPYGPAGGQKADDGEIRSLYGPGAQQPQRPAGGESRRTGKPGKRTVGQLLTPPPHPCLLRILLCS